MAHISEQLREVGIIDMENPDDDDKALLHQIMNNDNTQQEIIEVLEILLDRDVDADIRNKESKTVLHLAVKNRMKDVLDFLLTRNIEQHSATHFFIEDEHTKFQKLSIQKNNFNDCDSEIVIMETKSISFVEWLISKGFDFDYKSKDNQSAIFMAIERNLQHILPVLFKCSKEINFIDRRNRTLLHIFLEKKDDNCGIDKKFYSERYEVEIVKILLDRGVSADAEDNFKCTPIRIAIAKKEDIDIVEALIEHSENVNHKNSEGETLLHMVIRKWASSGNVDTEYYMKISNFLIAKGADVNEPDKNGTRPAFYAIQAYNLSLVEFLRKNGANFYVATVDGETLMHLFVKSEHNMETKDDAMIELFNLFLEDPRNVHLKNSIGETLFHTVIKKWSTSEDAKSNYYMKMANILVAKGVNVNEPDKYGTIPVVHAIERHNLHLAEFLRDNGADFSMTTIDGETFMQLLLKTKYHVKGKDEKNFKLFDLLLENLTNAHPKSSNGESLFQIVIRKWTGSKDVESDFYMKIAHALITKGADVNEPDKHGMTPLCHAVATHNRSLIEWLRDNGADFSVTTKQGESLLHILLANSKTKNHETIELFNSIIKNGAIVNCRNYRGETPLLYMITYNDNVQTDMVKLLLEYGADINAADNRGFTALHSIVAEETSDQNIIILEFLLKHGADFNALTRDGDSVLQLGLWGYHNNRKFKNVKGKLYGYYFDTPYKEAKILLKHCIKLNVAHLKCHIGCKFYTDMYKVTYEKFYEKCTNEIKTLKSTFIDDRTTLYDFLHMRVNRRRVFVNDDKLQELLHSPKLDEQFPEYSLLIWASYHEVVRRRTILKFAKKAWLELTAIDLPDICLEYIFSFLSCSDLFLMTEKG